MLTNVQEGRDSGPDLLAISLATGEPGRQALPPGGSNTPGQQSEHFPPPFHGHCNRSFTRPDSPERLPLPAAA